MPRRSKRVWQRKSKQGKKKENDHRVSVVESLGITPQKPAGTNLGEASALESAATADRNLNEMDSRPPTEQSPYSTARLENHFQTIEDSAFYE